jgi:phospholipase C
MTSKFFCALALPVVGSLLMSASSLTGCGADDDFVAPPSDGGADSSTSPPGDDDDDDDASLGGDGAAKTDGSTRGGGDAGDASTDGGGLAPVPAPSFQYHHQPFVYFKNWGGTGGAVNDAGITTPNGRWATNHNLQDELDFLAAAKAGTLPALSFVKPLYDEHPNYTTETDSQNHTVELINAVFNGPEWSSSTIIITYDENGGHADHVAPPTTDPLWGPGTRVPTIVISPFAKGGVDHTQYDTTSILTLVEKRWALSPLQDRDANQNDLSAGALTFTGASSLSSINHFVVIYLENHSFDSLFASWPGANGLADGGGAVPQIGPDGGVYSVLPEYGPYPPSVENLGDASVKNGAFDFTTYFQEGQITNDLLHRYYQEQRQINGGKMDSYVLWNNESAGQSMGYWPTSSLPVPTWMKAHPASVTLCDNFFHAAFGGSFLNHFWLIGARSPVYVNPPDAGLVATPVVTDPVGQPQGVLAPVADTSSVPPGAVYTTTTDGELTSLIPDGTDTFCSKNSDCLGGHTCNTATSTCTVNFAVNTSYSVNEPHPSSYDGPTPKNNPLALIPQQTWKTIGDELDYPPSGNPASGNAPLTWAWYAGGWNAAVEAAGIPSVATDAGVSDAGP